MKEIEVEEEDSEPEEPSSDEDDEIIKAFKTFDVNKSGKISLDEFKYIMTQIGDIFSPSEWDLLYKESEFEDGTTEIDYRQFVADWRKR